MGIPNQFLDFPQPCNLIGDGPEGPEVKIITDALQEILEGAWILEMNLTEKSRMSRYGFKGLEHLILPVQIRRVFCKGKQIFFELTSEPDQLRTRFGIQTETSLELYLNSRLGMSGQWVLTAQDHCDLELKLEDIWGEQFSIWYRDARHTGEIEIHTPEAFQNKLNSIGPDLLSEPVTLEEFQAKFEERVQKEISGKARKAQEVCEILMDQSVFSGIGNYVLAEVLYRAKVAPNRKVIDLSPDEISEIFQAAVKILKDSYRVNGCTRHQGTYQDPDGNTGKYADQLQVYERKTDPYGNKVQKDTFANKRTSHWVPAVQK